ncbi:MAG: metalloprotease TldD, partial [Neisseria sp.]
MQQTYPTVRHNLLEANHLSPELLARSLSIIGGRKVDYADIYCQHTAFESWHLEEGIVKSGSFQIEQGVGVRAVSGEKTAFAYADSLCIDSINRSAHAVRVIGAGGGEQHIRVPAVKHGKQVHSGFDPIASLDSAAKVALLNKVETLAKAADPRIVQVMAGLTCEYDMIYIARLDGRHAADIRPMVRLNVTVIAKQGDRREQGGAGGGGRYDLAYFDETLVRQFVDAAVKQALINLESRPAPAGEMTVVLGNGWPGVLLHE